jgi:hypothetical protein
MDKEIVPPTNFKWFQRLEVKRTRPVCNLVHHILAEGYFVGGGREGACISTTAALIIRVEIPFALPTVTHGIDRELSSATSKPASVLIEVITHGCACRQ